MNGLVNFLEAIYAVFLPSRNFLKRIGCFVIGFAFNGSEHWDTNGFHPSKTGMESLPQTIYSSAGP